MKIMWHPEQKSKILASQVTGPPKACMENIEMLPSSSVSERDLLAEPTRKRKTLDLDHQRSNTANCFSKLVLDYSFLGQSPKQFKVSASSGKSAPDGTLEMFSKHGPQTKELVQFCGKNVPDGALEMFSYHCCQTAEPAREFIQFSCNKYLSQNIMPFNERDPLNTMSDTRDSHVNVVTRCQVPEVLLANISSPTGKIPAFANLQSTELKTLSKIESFDTPHPIPNSMVKIQSDLNVKGSALRDLNVKGSALRGQINPVITSNSSYQLRQMPSEVFCSDILGVRHGPPHQANLSGSTQEASKSICSVESKQSERGVFADTQNGNNGASAKIGSAISKGTGDEAVYSSCHNCNDDQTAHSPENDEGAKMEFSEQICAGENIQNSERKEDQIIEKINYSLRKENSLHNAVKTTSHTVAEGYHASNLQLASCDLDGKCKASTGNVASSVVEKLWDGLLQLNASTKVSAVAFFKSGEKAPGFLWSQSIEVKGKVRLEAFEKFIQELPRSRSRGLMVTSLCWKVGSSDAGLNGMKQVAKSYKDGEKVGFAQLSPGIDLYVCPRSDTIITILAKYGFFKGMAAIQDDKDSLIGCFVWRRKCSSLDTVSKKPNKKNLLLPKKSPNSHTQINTITQLNEDASAQVDGSFTGTGSRIGSTAPESASSRSSECSNFQSIQAPVAVRNTSVNLKLVPPVPDSSPTDPCTSNTDAHFSSKNLQCCTRLKASAAPTDSSQLEKTAVQGVNGSLLIQPKYSLKQNKYIADDDDLPEFDFGIAYGVSHSSRRNSVTASGAVLSGLKPSMPHIIPQTTVANHSKSETPAFSNRLETNKQLLPQSKQWEDGRTMPLPFSGERPVSAQSDMSSHSSVCKPASYNVKPLKSRWNDDDDMPEWRPPDLSHQDHLLPTMPSFLPNLASEKKLQTPPMVMPIQTLPSAKQSRFVSAAMKPSLKLTNPADEHANFNPRSLVEPNSSLSFVSFPYNFDARIRTQSSWKGWRAP